MTEDQWRMLAEAADGLRTEVKPDHELFQQYIDLIRADLGMDDAASDQEVHDAVFALPSFHRDPIVVASLIQCRARKAEGLAPGAGLCTGV